MCVHALHSAHNNVLFCVCLSGTPAATRIHEHYARSGLPPLMPCIRLVTSLVPDPVRRPPFLFIRCLPVSKTGPKTVARSLSDTDQLHGKIVVSLSDLLRIWTECVDYGLGRICVLTDTEEIAPSTVTIAGIRSGSTR